MHIRTMIAAVLVVAGASTAAAREGLDVSLVARRSSVRAGDPVTLRFSWSNPGTLPVTFGRRSDPWRQLEITGEDGKVVRPPEAIPAGGEPLTLQPGEFFGIELDAREAFAFATEEGGSFTVSWVEGNTRSEPVGITIWPDVVARIETNMGPIVFEFRPDVAPATVRNFIKLAKRGFYDNLIFHRIIKGFMMQGGDPEGTGMGGPGYSIRAEFSDLKHVRGTVAMARSESPDSAGSQFYICFREAPFLDGRYTIFGQVTDGWETLDRVEREAATNEDRVPPRTEVRMTKVSIVKRPAPGPTPAAAPDSPR
jgi:cyclophilin family peptidyl-prolyl cis-trans isomerase